MKSWSYFIWFKRLAPLVLLALIWLGYSGYEKWHRQKTENGEMRMALVTARLWIASAVYRDSTDQYIAYRDSVLKANHLTLKEAESYKDKYSDNPEQYYDFATKVSVLVDSLYKVEDSLQKAEKAARDSAMTQPRRH